MYDKFGGNVLIPCKACFHMRRDTKQKEKKKDLIWLLKIIKEISSGLDKLVNECVTYYNALKSFAFMQMGEIKSEDSYVKRVHLIIETLILAGRKGALC